MDGKRQFAHERFRETEREWEDALHNPFTQVVLPGDRVPTNFLRLHEAAYAPGRNLDEWAKARGQGEHAVTGGLPTRSDLALHLRLTERKAALLDRIAIKKGRPEAAVQAEEARALASQLRAEIDGAA